VGVDFLAPAWKWLKTIVTFDPWTAEKIHPHHAMRSTLFSQKQLNLANQTTLRSKKQAFLLVVRQGRIALYTRGVNVRLFFENACAVAEVGWPIPLQRVWHITWYERLFVSKIRHLP
jgi:hypothetical protein